ncbi:Rhodanese-like protein [Myriangium duriaei CBS 260.36]|uniref:Rhodanese-like protein n=1 Tax=Myriangium duriaei CBS 260.36 TaxID=1168546 RepID=A0A9P4IUN2_9PEZI|nr:Rhodanese-like protein [Myriangium duriaei CBS 260.36]
MATASSSASQLNSYLVSPKQLDAAIKSRPESLIPISAAWFLPNDAQSRTGHQSFIKSHIPSSRFFDLDAIADTSSPYPHMLPDSKTFSSHMSRLGINNTDTVVIYDAPELGLFSAPRVAWTFRVFGHQGRIHVLNNYKLWVEQGYATTDGEQEKFTETKYEANGPDSSMVTDFEAVRELAKNNTSDGNEQQGETLILDARSKGRWSGQDPEPRKGLSSGHMPGSLSVAFTDLLDAETKTLKSSDELKKLFGGLGVTGDKPIVTSCGTGVTAAVVEAALLEAGIASGNRKVYDGSWTEWAQRASEEEGLIIKSK